MNASAIESSAGRAGEELTVVIEDLAYGGAGVAKVSGLVMFVPGTVPGDRARVRIRTRKPSFAQAELLEILEPSPDRVVPRCEHFGSCGGCQWMSLPYERQLAHKERQLREALARIGRLEGFTLHPIVPSPEVYEYRNKTEFTFSNGPRGIYAGLHAASDPSAIVEIARCHLQDEAANAILHTIVREARALGLRALDAEHPDPRSALMSVILRRGRSERPWLVILTAPEGPVLDLRALAERIRAAHPEVGGVARIAVRPDGTEATASVIAGEGTLTESIGDFDLTVSAGAFLQVNPRQAERLYARVEEFAAPSRADAVLDLYCGAGAITLLLARRSGTALGVEASRESVRSAERNAQQLGLGRCRFLRGEAGRMATDVAEGRVPLEREPGGRLIVVANPPRAGLGAGVIAPIAQLAPARIVYVSCNPATLARDLARLREFGFRTTDAAPFDMFPHTWHIETVVRLERD